MLKGKPDSKAMVKFAFKLLHNVGLVILPLLKTFPDTSFQVQCAYKTLNKTNLQGRQDGEKVGGCRVHLSPQMHQEYIFKCRSSHRTPADSRQESLTTG